MRVFNLTDQVINYRGKDIPPNGESLEFYDLSFIPDRDRELEKGKVLAFGSLPNWFRIEQDLKRISQAAPEPAPAPAPTKAWSPPPLPTTEVVVEEAKPTTFANERRRK